MWAILVVVGSSSAQDQDAAKPDAPVNSERDAAMAGFRKDFEEFPKAFWYAGDAWFQAQDLGGNVGDPAEFSRLHRLTDLAVKKIDNVIYAKFDLKDPDDPDEYWAFVFKKAAGAEQWQPVSGWKKYANGKKGFFGETESNLYKAEFRSPSMKPFILKAIIQMREGTGPFAPEKKPAVPAPDYQPLTGEGLSGSGFHITHRGRRFIVCSKHQFDGDVPEQMLLGDLLGDDEELHEVRVVRQIYYEDDIQILDYEDDKLDKIPGLQWSPGHRSEVGDPVYLYGDDGAIAAAVTSQAGTDTTVVPKAEFSPGGMSGSPVVSALTGKVIGVLMSADEPINASWVSFQNLELPAEIFAEPDPRSLPLGDENAKLHQHAVFGETGAAVQPEVLAAIEEKWFPLVFLHFGIGSTAEELRKLRLSFPGPEKEEKNARGHLHFFEFQPDSYVIESVSVEMLKGRVTAIELSSDSNRTRDESFVKQAELFTRFLTESLGAPDRIYKKIFPNEGKGFFASAGIEYLYLEWKRKNDVLQLELENSEDYGFQLAIIVRGEDAGRQMRLRKHQVVELRGAGDPAVESETCRELVRELFRKPWPARGAANQ